jgi:hypothetical protein
VAGNSTNGGTAISTDTSGTLNIVTGSGSGANAITIDASQAVTIPGNLTVSGTLSASGGVSGGIRSGTAVASTSGTSIDFTGIPTGVKRITVMLNGVSVSGTSVIQVQIGSGSITTTGYVSAASILSNATFSASVTSGFALLQQNAASYAHSGHTVITNISSNIWVQSGIFSNSNTAAFTSTSGGNISLGGTLDRIRITTVNGTDTFDAGSINILFE